MNLSSTSQFRRRVPSSTRARIAAIGLAVLTFVGVAGLPARADDTAEATQVAELAAAAGPVAYLSYGGKLWGEATVRGTVPSVLIVLYTSGASNRIDTSGLVLGVYRNHRRTAGVEVASKRTLADLQRLCGSGTFASKCRQATSAGQWSDFHSALVAFDARESRCLAVDIRSGVNWTTRELSDVHCK